LNDSKIARWVRMQRVTWQCDESAMAARIVLETHSGEQVAEWPTHLEELEQVIEDAVGMYADELPQGPHAYRLVAYSSDKRQLSELPQTIRGRSKDASTAASDALQLQKATALFISNVTSWASLARGEADKQQARLDDAQDNTSQLLDLANQLRGHNLEAELRLRQFEEEQKRKDQRQEAFISIITPLATMAVEKYGPKLLSMSPTDILEKSKAFLGSTPAEPAPSPPPAPAPAVTTHDLQLLGHVLRDVVARLERLEQTSPVSKEVPEHVRAETPTEPVGEPVFSVPQSEQGGVSPDGEIRSEGSSGDAAASGGKQNRKVRRSTPTDPTTKRTTNHQKKRVNHHAPY